MTINTSRTFAESMRASDIEAARQNCERLLDAYNTEDRRVWLEAGKVTLVDEAACRAAGDAFRAARAEYDRLVGTRANVYD